MFCISPYKVFLNYVLQLQTDECIAYCVGSKYTFMQSVFNLFGFSSILILRFLNSDLSSWAHWRSRLSIEPSSRQTWRSNFRKSIFRVNCIIKFCLRPMAEGPNNYLSCCSSGLFVNLLLVRTSGFDLVLASLILSRLISLQLIVI